MVIDMSPEAATQLVIWSGVIVGTALGAISQATRFCTMGAVADWFSYGGTARLTMWAIAVMVAAVGATGLIESGWLDATRTVALSERFLWLSYLVGGCLFGVGMVLASGCPQRSLVKAAAGNLKSWVTLMVAATSAQMTLRGVLAVPRVNFIDAAGIQLSHPQDLGSMLGALTGLPHVGWRWAALAGALTGVVILAWRARASLERSHWIGGVGVGLLVTTSWFVTGHLGFIAEHPETLEAIWMGTYSHRPEALSFAAPIAHALDLLTLWSDRNNTLTFGVAVTAGVLIGSAASALLRREFLVESFRDTADLGNHLAGGFLMGFGGVTAMGCSIGQGISGLSLLSAGALLAVAGIASGALLALRWQSWLLERVTA